MRLHGLVALVVAAATAGALVVHSPQPSPAAADITIIGDDDQDAFVGSGSLLLPPQIATDWRRSAADCPGCTWRSVIQCEMTTAGSCRGPARLCGADGVWLRVFMTRPGGVEVNLGAACFGSGGPVSRESAEALMRDRVITLVPALRTWQQPAGLALPHLPVIFGVTQSADPLRSSFELVGLPIDLTARPRWVWDFGSSTIATTSAGARWPTATISHTFRHSGRPVVTVSALWQATYEIAGVGPLNVADPVTQTEQTVVPVGQGRAALVR